MAYGLDLFTRSRVATTDLSSSQYCAVVLDSSGQAVLPAAGAAIYGVNQSKPKAGQVGDIRVLGVTKMVVGASTVAAGDKIMVDAAGKAVTATTTNFVVGVAESGGATGTTISVLLLPGGKI